MALTIYCRHNGRETKPLQGNEHHMLFLWFLSCKRIHQIESKRQSFLLLKNLCVKAFLHVSAFAVSNNDAHIATLENNDVISLFFFCFAENEQKKKHNRGKAQETFSTHESLYSTTNGFRTVEISSI